MLIYMIKPKDEMRWFDPTAKHDWRPKMVGLGFAMSLALLTKIRYKYDIKIVLVIIINSQH
jgi:hypothetical protein